MQAPDDDAEARQKEPEFDQVKYQSSREWAAPCGGITPVAFSNAIRCICSGAMNIENVA